MNKNLKLGALALAGVGAILFQVHAQTELGEGTINIFDTNGGNRFMVNTADDVFIGESGTTNSDADLIVRDPFFADTTTSTEQTLSFNASLSDLRLGSGNVTTNGDDGDIFLEDGTGNITITMNGSTGNVFQDVDNTTATAGNGLVKAWARINSGGTVAACWNCNTSASETQEITTGQYEVDFFLADINNRLFLATPNTGGRTIYTAPRSGDPSSVFVRTTDTSGVNTSTPFTVVVF